MRNFIFICITLCALHCFPCFAQQDETEVVAPKVTIFETLTNNSDPSKGTVIITQDERIKDLILHKKGNETKSKNYATAPGFRVQVFSSNEQKTGKSEAYKVEAKIKDKYPELSVYVSYFSPFWKVRVGDCLTNFEAQTLRNDLKAAFPEFQQETYIVKEQIIIPE